MTERGSHADNVEIKENWYDLTKYKDEIRKYIVDRKNDLGHLSDMDSVYNVLYRTIFTGASGTDKKERYPFLKELFNVYKSSLIEACLPGYSALMEIEGRNPNSILLAPQLKKVMTDQFKSIALIEKLTDKTLADWILKGEAVAFIKMKQTTERYREKETVTDLETGKEIMQFKVETGVTYEDLEVETIDPLDFYVDAIDYKNNPKACPKIIRTWISARELLTDKTNYPLLTEENKRAIIRKQCNRGLGYPYIYAGTSATGSDNRSYSKTAEKQIEVLTYMGDYVTLDGKLLTNIKAVTVEGELGLIEYNGVDSLQIIYAPYIVDRETHRGVSPLASAIPLNRLANKCVDLFLSNMDEVSNPVFLYTNGSIAPNALQHFRNTRELEYNDGIGTKPEWYSPPEISPNGINLLNLVLNQQKEMLGLNKYMSGDTTGSVRTAQESQILFQKANARMRVETDSFSYKFLLPLISSFYAFNRELALAVNHPLDDIYANPNLMVIISTGASKADTEGEFQKLMSILGMPAISQPMFQWASESGNMDVAIKYIMAKAGLTDADNILQLLEEQGNDMNDIPQGSPTEEVPEQQQVQGDQAVQEIMNAYNEPEGGIQ